MPARKSQRINHIYGGRNHKSLITSEIYYAHCLRYVYQNPIKAKICSRIENYKWSTASKIKSRLRELIDIPKNGHDAYIPKQKDEYLNWLNKLPPTQVDSVISKALKRKAFTPKTCSSKKIKYNLKDCL